MPASSCTLAIRMAFLFKVGALEIQFPPEHANDLAMCMLAYLPYIGFAVCIRHLVPGLNFNFPVYFYLKQNIRISDSAYDNFYTVKL
jgi:hypothetical protein